MRFTNHNDVSGAHGRSARGGANNLRLPLIGTVTHGVLGAGWVEDGAEDCVAAVPAELGGAPVNEPLSTGVGLRPHRMRQLLAFSVL
ncbi:hypothetical protein CCR75_006354 [Bremia lactucae]|uniref:Uncharacterized protein n=1 Tax=Bremia lactucae TaxID=4779 RepID=A0A976IM93_BRELC|nr:hypothetical protein CCR75_006354 [Bremia lactucae]